MVITRDAYLAFLVLLALERGAELVVSARHARSLLARGGVEAGRGHYRPMVIFHAAFLAACALEALAHPEPPPRAAFAALAGAVLAQGLRWWAIATLGERWSTRVIVLPGAPPVTGGPYRYLRHPNYLAVLLEMALVPLAFGSWRTALAFSAGNAALLAVRIRAEERALGDGWSRAFRGRPRFVLRLRGIFPRNPPGGSRDAA
jgi:methyltransferase